MHGSLSSVTSINIEAGEITEQPNFELRLGHAISIPLLGRELLENTLCAVSFKRLFGRDSLPLYDAPYAF